MDDEDLKSFHERGRCVVQQFNGYEIEPGVATTASWCWGNIGDLAGARIAYLAYMKSLEGTPADQKVIAAGPALLHRLGTAPGDDDPEHSG